MRKRIHGLLSLWLALSLVFGLLLVPAAATELPAAGESHPAPPSGMYTETGWNVWYGGPSDPDPAPAPEEPVTATIRIFGEEGRINVEAPFSSSAVLLPDIQEKRLNEVIGPEIRTGMVFIDMSHMSTVIESISIPVEVFSLLAQAAADPNNDTTGVTVLLPFGQVTFDAAALTAISAQADSDRVRLTFNANAHSLNAAQRAAMEELDVLVNVGVSLTNTPSNTVISDFRGGSVALSLPVKLSDDQFPLGLRLWHLDEEGQLTQQDSRYADGALLWSVGHFSDYIVTYVPVADYTACQKDAACPAASFTDIDTGAWYHDGIHYCLAHVMMTGLSDDLFAPDAATSRAMLVTILWRLEGEPSDSPSAGLRDVKTGLWYTEAVDWAYANGIVTGDGKGGFNPTGTLTREQLATILWRYAQYKDYDVSVGEDTNILSYEDALTISEYAIPALQWACGAGLIQGSGSSLSPAGSASRAQLATILMRLCESMAADSQ